MDLQTYLDNAMKASRTDSMEKSNQLTLWELILKLENAILQKEKAEPVTVMFDFGRFKPTEFMSWRWSYCELSIWYSEEGEQVTDDSFLEACKACVWKTFEWYKWWDFTMSKNTPVRVSNYWNANHTWIVDVVSDGWTIYLITQICNC